METILNWLALGVTLVLFCGLTFLSVRKKTDFGLCVLIATLAGIIVGVIFKGHTVFIDAFGIIWSRAISAIVVPLLLFSVIASVTNLGESIRLRGIGLKTVFFLLLNTATAALITLALSLLIGVGKGFQFHLPEDYAARTVPPVIDTIINLFPRNLMADWAANSVVPVVVFAILIAAAYNISASTEAGKEAVLPFKRFIDAGNMVLSRATQIIVSFTPYAVLTLIARAVSASNIASLLPLLSVLAVAYIAMALQFFIVQPIILAAAGRINPLPFFKTFWPAAVIAFTSQSSIGTIPVTVRQLKKAGVSEDIASFVSGLGANLGMPGCAGVWPVLLAVFAINSQGLAYTPAQFAFLIPVAVLVAIGTVGVPGTATITATSLFAATGLPIPFIAVAQPISQIVDMGRTALNVAGAANTAVIVAKTERDLNEDLYFGRSEFNETAAPLAEAVGTGSVGTEAVSSGESCGIHFGKRRAE